jgi:hypothetical protein
VLVEYCKIPPGDNEMADAYNLMVCSWIARHQPKLSGEAERMAKAICHSVTDWETVAASLAFLAAEFGNFCDKAMPETHPVTGVPCQRPTEKYRLAIEGKNLVPA